jgi:hypothetical protein
MEVWQQLLVCGIIVLIIYLYFERREFFNSTINTLYTDYIKKIYERSKQIASYPIDLDKKNFDNDVNVKLNRIFSDIVDLNNKQFVYPILFNSSSKQVETSDETKNPAQINTFIKYLEDKINSYDPNWQIKILNIKKIIKHLIDNQLQYDVLLNITITVKDANKNIQIYNRDVYFSVIINRYVSGQNKSDYEIYIKALNIANMDHYQYLSGLDKKLNLESLDKTSAVTIMDKKSENQKEVNGLTQVLDQKYPEYSVYETFDEKTVPETVTLGSDSIFMPSNNMDKYSNCHSDNVNTEEVLDIFQ